MARKLGASGAGMLMWPSSTPLAVMTKSMSPTMSGEQVARLCGKTPRSLIMSSFQTISPSRSLLYFSSLKGPTFLPPFMPAVVAQITSQRLLTYQMRLPSTTGPEQMPSSGQSLTRPASSLSWTSCQRNSPLSSLKHIRTPLSPRISLLRGRSLLVPMNILPPAKIGPP